MSASLTEVTALEPSTKLPHLAAFFNANSGAGKGREVVRALGIDTFTPLSDHVYVTKTIEELRVAAREVACNPKIRVIVVIGGDGTVKAVLDAVLHAWDAIGRKDYPSFIIIPMGTMNTVAVSIGLIPVLVDNDHIARRISGIAEKLRLGEPLDAVHLWPLKINGSYGFFFGAGSVVKFMERYYADTERGIWGAIHVIWATLWCELARSIRLRKRPKRTFMEEVHARVTLPDCNDPPCAPLMTHTAIMCASVDQIGLGCRGMPLARTRPGRFMLRSTSLSFWGLTRNFFWLYLGRTMPDTFDRVERTVLIEFQRPTKVMIDGDVEPEGTHFRITSGPRLRFITG